MANLVEEKLPMRALLAGARRKEREMIHQIRELVLIESPSDDPRATAACVAKVAEWAHALGGRVKIHKAAGATHKVPGSGGILEARFGAKLPATKQPGRILLLGHLDTVWPIGTLKTMPWRESGGKLHGPGVLDMKTGVVMALKAVELLLEAESLSSTHREVLLLLTTDEETGSHASRGLIEALAITAGSVLVLEPAQGLAYKTARKGTGNWRIEVEGVGAHAGVDFEKGRNAVRELARQIEIVSQWTELSRGLTVSVDVIGGGAKTNVIPASAWAEVDVRISKKSDGTRITRRFNSIRAIDKGCKVKAIGGINRPPMERTRATVKLYEKARSLARELEIDLQEAATGGASDGNFTSALGVATLDGMGAVGAGAHASHEHVVISELAPRLAMLAGLIAHN
jgi:glutamate carboxypeptidase